MMKPRFIAMAIMPAILLSSALLIDINAVQTKPSVVVILKTRDIEPYRLALAGFKSALEDHKIDFSIKEYSLEDKNEAKDAIIASAKSDNPSLILTIGTGATELAKANIKDTPIVFSMVLNPVSSGVVKSMQSSGSNLTGASMDISAKRQLEIFKSLLPRAKRFGVLYNPAETGVIIEEAKQDARGLGIELVAFPIMSEKDIPVVMEGVEKKIDALWAVADSSVFTPASTQYILLYTLRNGIPFMGLSSAYVKAGALFAVIWDYEDIGRQSGELAAQILSQGKLPAELSVTTPRVTKLSLNLRTADRMGVKIQSSMREQASEIFE